ncbi:hypothetical protein J5N97_011840 [Dioscorea zingiberensis]|uniref:Protein kinase domain-containing protein n=1 Tax=Dioscorea zingiberensis TaxID=325984 RepID=A0A9D5D197_9LILI|nr:hypothetical protein J5N97_011840 [Dioscorea zingiberensis]
MDWKHRSILQALVIGILCSCVRVVHAKDTLLSSQSMRDGDQFLISANQTFQFGFFSPEGSSLRYVGIWYHKLPGRTMCSSDPAPGVFSLGSNPKAAKQLFIWRIFTVYWDSGLWDGQKFPLLPPISSNVLLDYSDDYFSYSVLNGSYPIMLRYVMSVSGKLQQFIWVESEKEWVLIWSQPKPQCDVYNLCGDNGLCNEELTKYCQCLPGFEPGSMAEWQNDVTKGGCIRKIGLNCGSNGTDQDRFRLIPRIKFPVAVDAKFLNASSRGEWLDSSPGFSTWMILVIVAASSVLSSLVLVSCICYCLRRRKDATDNFSDEYKLGEGGFGPVYKGKLPEGREVAVKRLSTRSGQGLEEFKNEIVLIAKLQHRNLVRLLEGVFSVKSDVFSFGVILIGDCDWKEECWLLSEWQLFQPARLCEAWDLWSDGSWLELVDPVINDDTLHALELHRCIHVALLCVQDSACHRPTMSEVIALLGNENDSASLTAPKKPVFFSVSIATQTVDVKSSPSFSNAKQTCSLNHLSLTTMHAR